jgi:hypothetical protein
LLDLFFVIRWGPNWAQHGWLNNRRHCEINPMTKRRVKIEKDLFFEYEVSPHRAMLARISGISAGLVNERASAAKRLKRDIDEATHEFTSSTNAKTGMHIPFRQIRSTGNINPLKPPLHVETVLIGRALGQPTGYLAGVGFRIRDDGYVEGEFLHGVEKFDSFEELVRSVTQRLPRSPNGAKD